MPVRPVREKGKGRKEGKGEALVSPKAANAPVLERCLSFALYNTSTTLGPETALACRLARKPDDSSYYSCLFEERKAILILLMTP
jgi:hypothetical protein